MRDTTDAPLWLRLFWVVCLALPLLLLLLLPSGGLVANGLWFWLILFLCFWMLWMLLAARRGEALDGSGPWISDPGPRLMAPAEQPDVVKEIMDVRIAVERSGVRTFRGRLQERAETGYRKLKERLAGGSIPFMQQDEEFGAAIVLLPRDVEKSAVERPVRPWLHWTLFGLTFLTTTWAGAAHQGVNLWEEPARFLVGLPYSIGLLLILGVHELGHYFTARRRGIQVTPPFFIPVPFLLGTFGAFIQMRSPTETRRALFDVAVAGPLAGLVVAVPALLIGLQNSEVLGPEQGHAAGFMRGTSVGSSLLFALLAKLAIGEELQFGHVLRLSPLAFAGWLGLLVTALNLLPIGQLDGGHMARAMFGARIGQGISSVAMWSLFLLAIFVWPGLLLWVLVVFFIAGRGTPPLNDLTPISTGRQWIGYGTFLILALILIPLPQAFWDTAGIHCPYM